jgi:PTS hybrid protein
VGLVVVSHSARLAEGVVEVAAQMAPGVAVVPAGGTADGGIGTCFEAVEEALVLADGGAGVVVLYDLGSARMVADLAVESLPDRATAVVVDAPLVEAAVAAAVAAQAEVEAAALSAQAGAAVTDSTSGPSAAIRITLTNEIGLHARPSAMLARTVSEVDASVTVRFGERVADAASVLALMALGARGGDDVEVSATGRQADEALRRVAELAARGFDE